MFADVSVFNQVVGLGIALVIIYFILVVIAGGLTGFVRGTAEHVVRYCAAVDHARGVDRPIRVLTDCDCDECSARRNT